MEPSYIIIMKNIHIILNRAQLKIILKLNKNYLWVEMWGKENLICSVGRMLLGFFESVLDYNLRNTKIRKKQLSKKIGRSQAIQK